MWSILIALSACVTAPPTFEEYAQAWAEAQCADIEECSETICSESSGGGSCVNGVFDVDACVAEAVDGMLSAYNYACAADPTHYDQTTATDCLARYAQPGCMVDSEGDATCDPEAICRP